MYASYAEYRSEVVPRRAIRGHPKEWASARSYRSASFVTSQAGFSNSSVTAIPAHEPRPEASLDSQSRAHRLHGDVIASHFDVGGLMTAAQPQHDLGERTRQNDLFAITGVPFPIVGDDAKRNASQSASVVVEQPWNARRKVGVDGSRSVIRSADVFVMDEVFPERDGDNAGTKNRRRRRPTEASHDFFPRPRTPTQHTRQLCAPKVRLGQTNSCAHHKVARCTRGKPGDSVLCSQVTSEVERPPVAREGRSGGANRPERANEPSPLGDDLLRDRTGYRRTSRRQPDHTVVAVTVVIRMDEL